jgi:hypothetical protein
MARCWPAVWSDRRNAYTTLKNLIRFFPVITPEEPEEWREKVLSRFYIRFFPVISSFRYLVSGRNEQATVGLYDPAVLPDPRGWLEAHVGPLAEFEPGS